MKKIILSLVIMAFSATVASAQQWAISTNVIDWANFGTVNLEGSVAVARHFVLDVGAKYNPWNFGGEEKRIMNKQRMAYVAGRWYPWFSYDGWYVGVMAGWMEYASGGLIKKETEEGDAFGGGIGGGYTLLLGKHLNLNFGAYCWAGKKNYTLYECPVCGRRLESGSKFFVMPTNITLGITRVFDTKREGKNHRYHEGMDDPRPSRNRK